MFQKERDKRKESQGRKIFAIFNLSPLPPPPAPHSLHSLVQCRFSSFIFRIMHTMFSEEYSLMFLDSEKEKKTNRVFTKC